MVRFDRKTYMKQWHKANKVKDAQYAKKYKDKVTEIILEAKKGGCIQCGETDSNLLHFHHRDPQKGDMRVSRLRRNSPTRVLEEVAKCDLLCERCHWNIEKEKRFTLTWDDVVEIRRLWATGKYLQREIGKMFGVSQATISMIVTNKIWAEPIEKELQ